MFARIFWNALKIIEVLGVVCTAGGAIYIPIILDQATAQRRETDVETRTLEILNDVNRRIGMILSIEPKLQRHEGKYNPADFTYDAIRHDDKTNAAAISLLNEYDYICLGGNKELFTPSIMKDLRGQAIRATWVLYKDYIIGFRKAADEDQAIRTARREIPWGECDTWLKNNYNDWQW